MPHLKAAQTTTARRCSSQQVTHGLHQGPREGPHPFDYMVLANLLVNLNITIWYLPYPGTKNKGFQYWFT